MSTTARLKSRCLVVARAAVAVAACLPLAASALDCGDVLTQDTRLAADLRCDPGEFALVIGASGITVDLAGHTLTGPNTGSIATGGIGVLVAGPFTGVRILNGTIRGFGIGVRLDTTSGNDVRALRLFRNVRGIDIVDASDNVIENNRIEGSALGAVRLGGISSGNVLRLNALSANAFGIVAADASSGNAVLQNTVTSGGAFGIAVFTTGSTNVIALNTVSRGRVDGIVVSATSVGTVVSQNAATHNAGDGVRVDAATRGTRVERNTVTGNGDEGIDVRSAATTISSNTATATVDLGIEGIAGVTDGGGNLAFGNGNALQCAWVACAAK